MDDLPALMARLFSMSDATALGDLEGAADHLRSLPGVSGKLGCIGFCMGGRYALLFATASDRLDAAVDCWGGFIDKATVDDESTPERPVPPLQLVPQLSCPLLAAIGAEDHNPSPELAGALLDGAQAGGKDVKINIYEGAGHAFFADYRPSYRPGPAAELWEDIVPFLARHLTWD
jgi:carboxymethylenebutenolidase